MGGYGALRIALGYPDRFASAVSHSGAVLGPRRALTPPELAAVVGPTGDLAGTGNDLLLLATEARRGGLLPRLRLDCGTDDFLLDANRTFDRQLSDANVPHDYAEFPGGHDWTYWDDHVRDGIAFHLGQPLPTRA